MPVLHKSCQKTTVLQSTFYLTLSSLVLQILGFAYRILLSRMLTAEQMGIYGLMMPVYALLSALSLSGFSVAAVRTTAATPPGTAVPAPPRGSQGSPTQLAANSTEETNPHRLQATDSPKGVTGWVRTTADAPMQGRNLSTATSPPNADAFGPPPLDRGGTGSTTWASMVLSTSIKLYLPIFLLLTVIFAPISGGVAGMLGERGLQTALLLLLPCLLLTAFENLMKSVFQGLQNVIPSMISECSEQAVRILAVWGLLWYFDGRNLSGGAACALIVCGMMVSEVVSDLILGRFVRGLLGRHKHDAALSSEILRCALPICGGNACGMLLSSISGTMIPHALMRYGMEHGEALAAYGELSGMLLPLLAIPGTFVYPLCTVMLPRITEALAKKDMGCFRRRVRKTLWAVGISAFCFEGAAVVFCPALCALCFGERYPAGSMSILALGISMFAGLVSAGAGCVLNAMKRQSVTVAVGLVLGVLEIPLLYLAVGRYGIAGYAGVSAAAGVLQAAVLMGAVGSSRLRCNEKYGR